jgi:hypothetical protein
MRTFTILSFLLIVTLFSCSAKRKAAKTNAAYFYATADTTLVMSINKSYCFGKCPVYDMKIYANGHVTLHAIDHLELPNGHYTATISQQSIERIYTLALQIEYFNMEDVYTNPYIQDVPTTITSVLHKEKGVLKRIENTWEAPHELKQFEQALHNLLNELEWKAI